MIVLRNLTKTFVLNGRRKTVARNLNAVFPTGTSVALLGRNGAGKSTLLKMIAGTTTPTSGEILSDGRISFPVGLASSLHPDLTGAQNTRFVARIYGADTDALMAYVEEFAELGEHFHLPVRSYSSGMRGRLSFGVNMGLEFDTYLIDEVTAVGDAAFKRKSRDVFLARMQKAGAVFVSHSMGAVREMCKAGALIENGELTYYEDVEEAIERYMHMIDGAISAMAEPLPEGAAQMDFPRDSRMLFGIGLPQTRIDWVADCLRRHRPCHFAQTREPHYFDIRAGLSQKLRDRRFSTARTLAERMPAEAEEARRYTVQLLGEMSALLSIHTAPQDGPDRHDAYLDYLLARHRGQQVICDFTPAYALLGAADLAEMATVGAARFVCVLRDPVTRLWAQMHDGLLPRQRVTSEPLEALARALLDNPARLELYPETDYAGLFERLEAGVSPARLLYLFHEDLTGRAGLMPLTEFLDVPKVLEITMLPLPEEVLPPIPEDLRQSLRALLAPHYAAAEQRFGDRLPAAWRAADPAE